MFKHGNPGPLVRYLHAANRGNAVEYFCPTHHHSTAAAAVT